MAGVASDKAEFKVALDMQQFNPEDFRVKILSNYLIIEGRHQERQEGEGGGVIERQFTRKYLLPEGIKMDEIQCELHHDGVLTISAPKLAPGAVAKEKEIPVKRVAPPAPAPRIRHEEKVQLKPKEIGGTFEAKLPPGTIEKILSKAEEEHPTRQPLGSRHENVPVMIHHEGEAEHVKPASHHVVSKEKVPAMIHHEAEEETKPTPPYPMPKPEEKPHHVSFAEPKVEHVLPIPPHAPTAETQLPGAQAMRAPLAEHHVTMAEHHLALAERHVEKAAEILPIPGQEEQQQTGPQMESLRMPKTEAPSAPPVPPPMPEYHLPPPEYRPPQTLREAQVETGSHIPRPELHHVDLSEVLSPKKYESFHVPQPELRHVPLPEDIRGSEEFHRTQQIQGPPPPASGFGTEHITPLPSGVDQVERTKFTNQPPVHEYPGAIGTEAYQPVEQGADVIPGRHMGPQYLRPGKGLEMPQEKSTMDKVKEQARDKLVDKPAAAFETVKEQAKDKLVDKPAAAFETVKEQAKDKLVDKPAAALETVKDEAKDKLVDKPAAAMHEAKEKVKEAVAQPSADVAAGMYTKYGTPIMQSTGVPPHKMPLEGEREVLVPSAVRAEEVPAVEKSVRTEEIRPTMERHETEMAAPTERPMGMERERELPSVSERPQEREREMPMPMPTESVRETPRPASETPMVKEEQKPLERGEHRSLPSVRELSSMETPTKTTEGIQRGMGGRGEEPTLVVKMKPSEMRAEIIPPPGEAGTPEGGGKLDIGRGVSVGMAPGQEKGNVEPLGEIEPEEKRIS